MIANLRPVTEDSDP